MVGVAGGLTSLYNREKERLYEKVCFLHRLLIRFYGYQCGLGCWTNHLVISEKTAKLTALIGIFVTLSAAVGTVSYNWAKFEAYIEYISGMDSRVSEAEKKIVLMCENVPSLCRPQHESCQGDC